MVRKLNGLAGGRPLFGLQGLPTLQDFPRFTSGGEGETKKNMRLGNQDLRVGRQS